MNEHAHGTRLLIATGVAVADTAELPPVVRMLIDAASEILVITPILPSGVQWLVSDTDRARHDADERLEIVMRQIAAMAPSADLHEAIGDETPLTAFADAVGRFHPDHILIARRAEDHEAWQERHLVDRLLHRFHIPLSVFEIDRAGHVPRQAPA
jgi:hypothetical protein